MIKNLFKILIIAGSDPSGGAGLQADLKIATLLKTYSAGIITSLTAQNTQKVSAIFNPPISFLEEQLNSVLSDIKFDAIKIGMLGSAEIIEKIVEILSSNAKNIPVILDPVMVATSGDLLLEKGAIETLKLNLIKQSFLITPNIDEAMILANMSIKNLSDMKKAALKIKDLGAKNCLIKGGHIQNSSKFITNLLLTENGKFYVIKNPKIAIDKIHGTGCNLASAIACHIANGFDLIDSVKRSNRFVFKAIKNNLAIGKGSRVLGFY